MLSLLYRWGYNSNEYAGTVEFNEVKNWDNFNSWGNGSEPVYLIKQVLKNQRSLNKIRWLYALFSNRYSIIDIRIYILYM
jgi:hypothetical protein